MEQVHTKSCAYDWWQPSLCNHEAVSPSLHAPSVPDDASKELVNSARAIHHLLACARTTNQLILSLHAAEKEEPCLTGVVEPSKPLFSATALEESDEEIRNARASTIVFTSEERRALETFRTLEERVENESLSSTTTLEECSEESEREEIVEESESPECGMLEGTAAYEAFTQSMYLKDNFQDVLSLLSSSTPMPDIYGTARDAFQVALEALRLNEGDPRLQLGQRAIRTMNNIIRDYIEIQATGSSSPEIDFIERTLGIKATRSAPEVNQEVATFKSRQEFETLWDSPLPPAEHFDAYFQKINDAATMFQEIISMFAKRA